MVEKTWTELSKLFLLFPSMLAGIMAFILAFMLIFVWTLV